MELMEELQMCVFGKERRSDVATMVVKKKRTEEREGGNICCEVVNGLRGRDGMWTLGCECIQKG